MNPKPYLCPKNKTIMAKLQQVLQVSANKDGIEKILFFGSVSAIYEKFSIEELGIAYKSLLNYFTKVEADEATHGDDDTTYIYRNKKCTIIKGVLITKAKSPSRQNQNIEEQ